MLALCLFLLAARARCLAPSRWASRRAAIAAAGGVKSDVTFEEAQDVGETLLEAFLLQDRNGTPLPSNTAEDLDALLATTSGARGWFVLLLTDPVYAPLFSKALSPALLEPLEKHAEVNVRLMTMNVAMSTAMAVAHARNGDSDMASASTLTSDRSVAVVEALMDRQLTPTLRPALRDLLNTAAFDADDDDGNTGVDADWVAFLDRWGYDATQRNAIAAVLARMLNGIRS
ncbi:hypothetical protein M885DRAFT_584947 [Pelagophyceae sp. CCMP2097]|nr:hypothetical protein M885DRAFT_584947 [Pelagophyceae sp. CCMP2097]